MKQRFSSLDVKAVAHELQQSLVSLRLSNVYDLSSKILLLKFQKPEDKKQLIIDSGFRCHLTDFARTAAPAPSAFVARLRKFLKTRRVTAVQQIGTDRIIEFQFSDGQYRLYLEFFASGNVILTDSELKILTLLRNVKEGEGQEPQRVGLKYSLDNRQNYGGVPALTKERLRDALTEAAKKAGAARAGVKGGKKKAGGDLRRGLATTITELPPILVDHALKANNFDVKIQASEVLENEATFDALFKALGRARAIVDEITSSATVKGFIVAKKKGEDGKPLVVTSARTANAQDTTIAAEIRPFVVGSAKDLLYEDFSPFLPEQFARDPSNTILTFEEGGFNRTVDEFFSSLEGQKLESRLTEKELAARRKLEATRRDHARRVEGLQEAQLLNVRRAAAIEANVERVQEAMDAVIGLLEQGMDWVDVGRLIEREQKRRNPVAEIIKLPLDLANDTITLVLGEGEEVADDDDGDEDEEGAGRDGDGGDETDSSVSEEDDDDDDDDGATTATKAGARGRSIEVDINLNLSPWSNVEEYYDQKRSAAVKQEKTLQQSTVAIRNAERKIAQDLKKGLKQEKPLMQAIRRQLWFEKFLWFVSSDGYLVLGGRDAQQNELLYRRHLRRGDAYVHADLHGAASVVVKNDPRAGPDAPLPPSTLSQAGQLAVCSSAAWDQKAGMGAYWVGADQVSKSAPAGEYLPTGSFMVRGRKNFLPPAPLVLGFGLFFRVSEESRARHPRRRHGVYGGGDNGPGTVAAAGGGGGGDAGSHRGRSVAGREDPAAASGEVADRRGQGREEEEEEKEDGASNAGSDGEDANRVNPLQSNPVDDEGYQSEDEGALPPTPPTEGTASTQGVQDQEATPQGEASRAGDDVAQENEEGEGEEETIQEAHEVGAESAAPSTLTVKPATSTAASTSPLPSHRTPKQPQQQQQQQGKPPPKRGQKGKAKKIASKYRDQDEEDRAAAEALLGAAAGRAKREAEARLKAEEEAAFLAARERRRQQHLRQQLETARHEEARKRELQGSGGGGGAGAGAGRGGAGEGEGGDHDDGEQQAPGGGGGDDALGPLDALVGTPLQGDELLECVPVCAPYAALGRVKYKVKMQPGQQKKGKAVKEVLEGWKAAAGKKGVVDELSRDGERMWPREVELIRALKPEEAINCVPVGKVKLMVSGGLGGGGGGGSGRGGGGGGGRGGKGGKKK